tara:strand:+ start:157 stop:339 length:183 start_codon:yes stop_codon:yes gene_type:complete
MFTNDRFVLDLSCCIYENEDIMLQLMFMSYPDNIKEAVMSMAMLKGGRMPRMETGATSLN